MPADSEQEHYKVYTITTNNERNYISFDLGKLVGGKEPTAVFTLNTDGVEDEGTFTDQTDNARSLSGSTFDGIRLADVQYDALYVCFPEKFTGLDIDIDVAGVDAGTLVATWEYVQEAHTDGQPKTWTDLNEDDGSASAAGKGLDSGTGEKSVKWIIPSDWVKAKMRVNKDEGFVEGYWVKFMVGTAGYSTAPELESISVIRPKPATAISVLLADNDYDLHLNSEPTAGSLTEKDAIPIYTGQGMKKFVHKTDNDEGKIDNFIIKNFSGNTVIIAGTIDSWREALAGTSTSHPGYMRIQDGDGLTLADVLASTKYTWSSGVAKGTQSATTLQDTDKSWTVNELAGMIVVAHSEEEAKVESHTVVSNTADTITITGPWANNPVTTVTEYKVVATGNALLVKISDLNINAEEINISNIKGHNYKSSPPDLTDGEDTQALTDIKGRTRVVGAAPDGSAVAGDPVRMGMKDGGGLTQDIEGTDEGILLNSEIQAHQGSEAYTYNTDLTVNTYSITVNGKTYTTTYVYNSDLTIASSSMAVT
jgi:hypothetical protein